MTKETWGRYVSAISTNQSEIAERVGSSSSTVSRWVSGDVVPSAQMVIQLARAYGLSPVAALVAAGYLEPREITDSGVQPRSLALHEFSDLELAQEIVRRAAGGSAAFDHPAKNVGPDGDTAGIDSLGVLTGEEVSREDLGLAADRRGDQTPDPDQGTQEETDDDDDHARPGA